MGEREERENRERERETFNIVLSACESTADSISVCLGFSFSLCSPLFCVSPPLSKASQANSIVILIVCVYVFKMATLNQDGVRDWVNHSLNITSLSLNVSLICETLYLL
jgi:low affinity Fe/Cu permease